MSHPMTAAEALSNPAAAFAATDPPSSLLRLAVGDEVLAVSIEDVREILQVSRLTPLPRTPSFVRGVMNLRGAVVPVIDLAARLDLPPTVIGRRSCIVIVECVTQLGTDDDADETDAAVEPLVVGLLVDAVFEVFDRAADEIESAPALGTGIAHEFLRGMTRAHGELIGVLALGHVLAARELAAAIASYQPHA